MKIAQKIFRQFFDDDNDPVAAEAARVAAAEAARVAAARAANKKEYSQDEIDDIVKKRTEQARRQAKEHADNLEKFKQTAQLTEQQVVALDLQIEELRKQNMTAEEIRKRDLQTAEQKHARELKEAKEKEGTWKSKHDNLLVDSETSNAAIKHEVLPGVLPVVAAYLKPLTRVSDAGQGNLTAIVSFPDIDSEGKEYIATFSIDKAMARMKELPQFATLFKGTATGGAGASGSAGKGKPGGKFDFKNGSMEAFMKARAEGKA